MKKSKVLVRTVVGARVENVVSEILRGCGWEDVVAPDATVILKPNLCCPRADLAYAANTDVRVLEAVIATLGKRTRDIWVGESDGTRFKVEECAAASGYERILAGGQAKWVNFSTAPSRRVDIPMLEDFELPAPLLDADVVISLPVLKTHALTEFTGALKNQWGCIPRYDRILLHKHLDPLIVFLNSLIRPQIGLMDGIWAMEGRGPVNGKPIRLDVLLGSRDVVALDATAMRLVGLDPYRARHVRLAAEAGIGWIDPGEIEIDGDFEGLKRVIEPARCDIAIGIMNYLTRYRFFTYRVLLNDAIFARAKAIVVRLRAAGLI